MPRIEINEEASTRRTAAASSRVSERGSSAYVLEVRKEAVALLLVIGYRFRFVSVPFIGDARWESRYNYTIQNPSGSRSLSFCLHFNWLSDLLGGEYAFSVRLNGIDRLAKLVASHPLVEQMLFSTRLSHRVSKYRKLFKRPSLACRVLL